MKKMRSHTENKRLLWQHLITTVTDNIRKMTVKGVQIKLESFFLTLLPTAFYDFLSYRGDFYPTPQKTMLKLFDWFEIWYT